MRWSLSVLGAFTLLVGGYGVSPIETVAQSATNIATKPLILEKDDGEHRVRRPRQTPMLAAEFTIKVDPKNGASRHLVLGTETIPLGGQIARHKHIGQDEIVLIQRGSAHVWLGSEERDVHAGSVVFIPSETWIGLRNTGNENINLAFVFSNPASKSSSAVSPFPREAPPQRLARKNSKHASTKGTSLSRQCRNQRSRSDQVFLCKELANDRVIACLVLASQSCQSHEQEEA